MRRFRFHWRDDKMEEGDGHTVSDAFTRLGYGGGALRALDYWEDVQRRAFTEAELGDYAERVAGRLAERGVDPFEASTMAAGFPIPERIEHAECDTDEWLARERGEAAP